MVEQTDTTAPDPGRSSVESRATLEELVAEPERVADEAATGPVRIERTGAAPLVLVDAAAFERLQRLAPTVLRAEDLTDEEIAYMLAQPIPPALSRFDDEVPEGWLDGPH